ncbi:short-chain type dehydrogenase/reductase [Mycobacterium tuberculosis T92]|nr:short-chain type dehydrogenase/reductase [Mycobacterium tuberculosis T92]
MDLSQRLAGRVAVITGGGSGIGLAAGRRMRAEGATIVVGDVDVEAGGAAADELSGLFVPTDVCDEDAVNGLFDGAAETYGRIDIAFNNAGISPPEDNLIENTELAAWQRVQDVNLKSVYLCCRAALRHMVLAGKRLHRQHGVLRCGDGFGNVADLLTPPLRVECWLCHGNWACNSLGRASGSTRCARGR